MDRLQLLRSAKILALNSAICMVFAIFSPAVLSGELTKAARPVNHVQISGLESISSKELLYLLDIWEGQPLDRKALRLGLKRAFLKGIFKDIEVESPNDDLSSIRITVKERSIIKSIDISGNNHFSSGFIRKNIALNKGDRLNEMKLSNGVAGLNDLLHKKGFPDARITYSVRAYKQSRVTINLLIEEGAPVIVKGVRISGGLENDRKAVASRLKLSVGDVFDQISVDQSIEKIKADYKKLSYIETQAEYSFENSTLDFRFSPGKKLTVDFEGNSTIGSSSLKKEIPFYELDEFSDDLLEETVIRIVGLYHGEGFADAQIAPVMTADDRNIAVKFYIHEGDRYSVDKVDFEGASIPVDKLKEIIRLQPGSRYNPDAVSDDAESLKEFYRSLGYVSSNVQDPEVEIKEGKASVKFRITEGIQVRVSSITIKNNKAASTEEILKAIPLKYGNPYNDVDLFDSRVKIQNLYRNKGFLDAAVTIESPEISNDKASVTFSIQEGSETYFGKNIIVGNQDTRRAVITRSLLHKEKEAFNYSLLLGERQRLYRTGLFTDVEAVPWQPYDHTRDVLYRLEEGDAGAVEFGGGYGEYEKFRGFVGVSYKNLFGMNRQITFRTEMSTLARRFILQYFEPRFLDTELAFKAQLLNEYKKELNIDTRAVNYRLKRNTATAGFEKKLGDNLKVEGYYELDNVKTYDVQPDIILSHEDTGTLLISGIKTGLIYDSRDNPVNPTDGILGGITYKIATALLFSETDFHRVQMYLNKYLALTKGVVLAVSVRGGAAKGFSHTTELPLVERFFLGGRTTVRGYAQDTLGPKGADNNPTGGNAFLMGNFEFRFDIWKGFGLVAFVDSGNVWQKVEQVSFRDIKYTTGSGLRYNTPVGPLSIDYGYKLNRENHESRGEIHFSVGQSF